MKKIIFTVLIVLLLIPVASAVSSVTRSTYTSIATGGAGFVTLLDYDPSPAQPGQFLILYIKVENSGGDDITNAKYILEPKDPFVFKGGEDAERVFGTIGSQQQVLLEYDLYVDEDAYEGTYTIPLKLCLDQNCDDFIKKEIDITVQTGGIPGIEVGLEESDIFKGGKRGQITLHVINRGDLDAKYLVMELMPTKQFEIISPSRIYVGEMESDDFETAEFDIFINGDVASDATQRIDLPVFLDYSDANDKKYSETQSVGLTVYSNSDMAKMSLGSNSHSTTQYFMIVIGALIVIFLAYKYYFKKKFIKKQES
ncbi:hypothetical protein GF374_00360 [Candidatus Woesearchaeota archaeon]|nr:hypothetical protein [Candidatus Woesearchaeota archaeon]